MKKTGLTSVLKAAAKGEKPEKSQPNEGDVRERTPTPAYREGRVNVTAYFLPAVKSSLRAIQVLHPDKTQQDLIAEALNDLFAKYNVPQTADTPKDASRRR